MTVPVSYQTRAPGTVDAMYAGDTGEFIEDIVTWMTPLLPEDAVLQNNMGMISVSYGNFYMNISGGYYVYVDEDGFHVVSKGAFEMHYEVAGGV